MILLLFSIKISCKADSSTKVILLQISNSFIYIVVRLTSESYGKQDVVVEYGTVSSDALVLDVSRARQIMQHLLDRAKNDHSKNCTKKTTLRLGVVNVTTVSSSYKITGAFEHLPEENYSRWDFITCADHAGILDNVVKDPALAPMIHGDYSNFTATAVKILPNKMMDVKKCCRVGSVLSTRSCGNTLLPVHTVKFICTELHLCVSKMYFALVLENRIKTSPTGFITVKRNNYLKSF